MTPQLILKPGVKYRIRFKVQGGNGRTYEKEMVGTYLSYKTTKSNQRRWHGFNLRPVAGTAEVAEQSIVSAVEVEKGTQCRRPSTIS